MMSIRSLADNMELPGWRGDWLAPPPSLPRARSSARHDERGGGDFYLATSGDLTWPPVGTCSWPWTGAARLDGHSGARPVDASSVGRLVSEQRKDDQGN